MACVHGLNLIFNMIKIFLYINALVWLNTKQQVDYPTPQTPHMLFYIQRNHNENAIVYDAKFDRQGNLIADCPVDAYWIRFQENGQRKELRSFEKWMVYGVSCQKLKHNKYDYRIYLSASKKLKLWLRQTAPFKAEIIVQIKGKKFRLKHMFATADESGWLPKVLYGEIYGEDLNNNSPVYIKVFPKDIK